MKKNSTTIKKVSNPESLAKAKGVAASITRQKGTYVLVTVIEGEIPNQQLASNLTLVSNQRRQLADWTAKYEALPVTSVQERELHAGQINDLKKLLTANLKQMGEAYAYSLQNEYLLVPCAGTLHLVDPTTKQVSADSEHEFTTTEDYEEFQLLRHEFAIAKATLTKLEGDPEAGKLDDEDAAPIEEKPANAETDAAQAKMEETQQTLMETYHCDAGKNYELRLKKSALYAKSSSR